MAAIKHVQVRHFRGFDDISFVLRDNAVLVGVPGSGRSDLLEAIARVLDFGPQRSSNPTELDFFDLDTSKPASVELVIGDLAPGIRAALTRYIEIWDREDEKILASLPAGSTFDAARHELAVRFGYRTWLDNDILEQLYWPKFADAVADIYPGIRAIEREQIPFVIQRGMSSRPLDLGPRGEFRALIAEQAAAGGYAAAVRTFLRAVENGSSAFTSDPAVESALEEVLKEIRGSRRFDDGRRATDILSFLPDGGSEAGLLRSLSAVASLYAAPNNLSTVRHGSSVLASLRAGLLIAVATRREGTIVIVEDLGGEIDPHLSRHVAIRLRNLAGQVIASTRTSAVVEAFGPDEVIRLHGLGPSREASSGERPRTKPQRLAMRYWSRYLIPALHASTVVIVEGHTDRIGYRALADRCVALGLAPSLDAAGIAIVEAGTNNQAPRLAEAARALGLFTIILLDDSEGLPAVSDPVLQDAMSSSDAVIRLPRRTSVEQALVDGVADAELIRVFREIDAAVGGLTLGTGWETKTGTTLSRHLANIMHKRTGAIHEIYVEALEDAHLPPIGIQVIREIVNVARANTSGALVQL